MNNVSTLCLECDERTCYFIVKNSLNKLKVASEKNQIHDGIFL